MGIVPDRESGRRKDGVGAQQARSCCRGRECEGGQAAAIHESPAKIVVTKIRAHQGYLGCFGCFGCLAALAALATLAGW